jgi:NADH dehydrogenase
MPHRLRVVIVGAGFGGLWTAKALRGQAVDVTLIDRNNYHTFLPLLYQVGAAELNAVDISFPVRTILRKHGNVRFLMAEVDDIDFERRRVSATGTKVPYDRLVLATGSDPFYFEVKGAQEYSFPLKRIEDGLALRNHVLSRFERAARQGDAVARKRALTFAIVGGGPTGVEYAGALAELISGPVRRDYPELAGGQIEVVLLEALDELLVELPPKLGMYARGRLERMGVKVRTGSRVREIARRSVRLGDGTEIPTETVVWTAGVRGDKDAQRWGLPTGPDGTVCVEPTLQVCGHPDTYVVGDLASFRDVESREPLPMIAPVATQQGDHVGRNVIRELAGKEPLPFRFRDPGMLVTVGRNAAVANVFGRAFTGFPAWVLWLVVHLLKLMGFRNRLVVLTNWAFDYFFFERAVRLILPVRQTAEIEASRGQADLSADESVLRARRED